MKKEKPKMSKEAIENIVRHLKGIIAALEKEKEENKQ